jgi:hypothetical protein
MTEADWLACDDPLQMLNHLGADPTARKTLLLTSSCLRRLWRLLPDHCRAWAESVEEAAEGRADPESLNRGWESVEAFLGSHDEGRCYAVLTLACVGWYDPQMWEEGNRSWRSERQEQARLVRDVFGNPFRPVSLDPSWQTATVQSLADAAYERRLLPSGELDTARLAILADGLEEAGSTDEAILGHLRSPGPHHRGCFAVDAILEKG